MEAEKEQDVTKSWKNRLVEKKNSQQSIQNSSTAGDTHISDQLSREETKSKPPIILAAKLPPRSQNKLEETKQAPPSPALG